MLCFLIQHNCSLTISNYSLQVNNLRKGKNMETSKTNEKISDNGDDCMKIQASKIINCNFSLKELRLMYMLTRDRIEYLEELSKKQNRTFATERKNALAEMNSLLNKISKKIF